MRFLLRIINRFFVFLGVIFFILIAGIVYLFIADPFNLKPILKMTNLPIVSDGNKVNPQESAADTSDKNPLLNDGQEKILESFGINPAALPTVITPEMEICFRESLGEERVNEIMKTGQPDMADFFKARSCL